MPTGGKARYRVVRLPFAVVYLPTRGLYEQIEGENMRAVTWLVKANGHTVR